MEEGCKSGIAQVRVNAERGSQVLGVRAENANLQVHKADLSLYLRLGPA